ncbi:MAG: ATP-binding protein [Candidatus Aerophobetes bacterium]|uniref:histidine kinase n=1 Tax=Aerophobetes bacterium TaxID=2030807 RepID=A0A523W1L8_UNCAE|nr:MAG: ATP-binding protein [Candidatus Aerophobetes bacterium]
MEDLSLHILDIVENSIRALAKRIEIRIEENIEKDWLTVEIEDNGQGMDEETIKKALDPFFTTKTTGRVGLGLPLLHQAARETGGKLEISSEVGKKTRVRATFRYSHPDRKPLGNIKETLLILAAGYPEVDFVYEHKRKDTTYRWGTKKIKDKKDDRSNH